jgi:hypothetical protein
MLCDFLDFRLVVLKALGQSVGISVQTSSDTAISAAVDSGVVADVSAVKARFVKIQQATLNALQISFLEVFDVNGSNVALGKSATTLCQHDSNSCCFANNPLLCSCSIVLLPAECDKTFSNSPFESLFKQKAGIIFMRELVPLFPNCHSDTAPTLSFDSLLGHIRAIFSPVVTLSPFFVVVLIEALFGFIRLQQLLTKSKSLQAWIACGLFFISMSTAEGL